MNVQQELESLHARISQLESSIPAIEQTDIEKRTYEACKAIGLQAFKLQRAPSDYYTWNLEKRRNNLGAYSIHHLCKSIIVENTECTQPDCSDPRNSKFYCIIIQYTSKLLGPTLLKYVRSLKDKKVPLRAYHFKLAKPEDTKIMTGSDYNGVCPLGMPIQIPIILSQAILDLKPGFIWLGGGEVDLKLGLNVSEFVERYNPFVCDLTEPIPQDQVIIEDTL